MSSTRDMLIARRTNSNYTLSYLPSCQLGSNMDVDGGHEVDPLTDSIMDNIIDLSETPEKEKASSKRKSDEATTREGKENGAVEKRVKTDNSMLP